MWFITWLILTNSNWKPPKSCKHISSKVKSELPDHVEKNQVVKQKTKKVKLSEDCQLCLNQNEDDERLGTDFLISMTSLLTHTVAHSTRPSFRPKTNNRPLKKFLSLAVSWVKVVKNGQILTFKVNFLCQKLSESF